MYDARPVAHLETHPIFSIAVSTYLSVVVVVVVVIVVIVVVVAVVVVVVIVVVSALVMFLYTLNSSYSLCTLPARTPLSYLKMFFIGLRRLPNRRFRYLIASHSMIPDTEALGSEPSEPDTGCHVHIDA